MPDRALKYVIAIRVSKGDIFNALILFIEKQDEVCFKIFADRIQIVFIITETMNGIVPLKGIQQIQISNFL